MPEQHASEILKTIHQQEKKEVTRLTRTVEFLQGLLEAEGKNLNDLLKNVPGVVFSDLEDLADQYCFSKGFGIIHTQSYIQSVQSDRDRPLLRSLLNSGKHTLPELIKSGRLIHPVAFGYIESVNREKVINEIEQVSRALTVARQKLHETESMFSTPKSKPVDDGVRYIEDDEMARIERNKGYRSIRDQIANQGRIVGTTDFVPPLDDDV